MTTEPQKQNTPATNTSPLSASILSRIHTEHLTHVPRWQFLCTEYGIWALWFVSVFVGAISFSVMLFFMQHAGFALYEATHDNIFGFLLDVMPFAWIVVFVLMALFAHFNLRHTKHGYRYKVWQVLLSSIVCSFIGGVFLHMVGMSFLVDDFMNKEAPFFGGLQGIETRMWQKPKEGRMIGTYTGKTEIDDVVLFTDNNGASWQLNIAELNPMDLDSLYEGTEVRVLGVPSSTKESFFQGCGVFPLALEKDESFKELRKERDSFISRMKEHHKNMSTMIKQSGVRHLTSKPLCGGHSAVMRVKRELAPQ